VHRPTAPFRPALVTAAAALLLALHWWLGVTGWFSKTVTSDETAHLVSGYAYWKFDDYRFQPENGNLPQRWGALPLLALEPRLEPAEDPPTWSLSNVWGVGQRFFFESGNETDFLLASARGTMALWSVAVGALVFAWSRRLWGDLAGLFSLGLHAFSATALAHGPLVTSDMCAAFFLLAAPGAFWRFLERPGAGRLAASLALTGFATVAKFSFVVLPPIYALLILAQACRRRGLPGAGRWWAILAGATLAHVVAAWAIIWASFGFRHSGFAAGLPPGWKYYIPWSELLPAGGWKRWVLVALKDGRLLPEAYVHGFAYVLHAAENRGAFLAGHYSQTGWWWFFPYAFLVKTPVAELAALGLAGLVALRRGLDVARGGLAPLEAGLRRFAPLLALLAVFGLVSVTSNLNIGHRHLLPIYPPLFILAGVLVRPAATRAWKGVALVVLLAAAVDSARIRPNYLAHFNLTVGGSDEGWRHLVDSSLDWGQDLPGLKRWLDANRRPGEKVYLSYFGMGDARYEGIAAEPLAPYYQHYRKRYYRELEPGLFCLSATMLQDPYSPWAGEWGVRHETAYRMFLRAMREQLAAGRDPAIAEFGEGESNPLWNLDRLRFARLCLYLRRRPADAIVESSILVFRLDAAEVRTVVDGTPDELASLIESRVGSR